MRMRFNLGYPRMKTRSDLNKKLEGDEGGEISTCVQRSISVAGVR